MVAGKASYNLNIKGFFAPVTRCQLAWREMASVVLRIATCRLLDLVLPTGDRVFNFKCLSRDFWFSDGFSQKGETL